MADGSGIAAFHPPKTSSGAIFGGPCVVPLDPKPDELIGLPHAEKSLALLEIAGDLMVALGLDAVEGSGVAQASFEPQASSLAKPENDVELAGAEGADLGAGWEGADKLKAELMFEAGTEGFKGAAG